MQCNLYRMSICKWRTKNLLALPKLTSSCAAAPFPACYPCSTDVYVRSALAEQPLPYHPQRQGVPVTRFTAAPGMLVRRGYDVASGEDGAAMESGEVRGTLILCWAN